MTLNPDEMEACAELIELALGAYLTAHPRAKGERVTAVELVQWVKTTAETAKRSTN